MGKNERPSNQLARLILGLFEGGLKGLGIVAILCIPLILVFLYILILALS